MTLRSGRSLNNQPENTRRHWLSLPCTTNWMKAPVSAASSHDADFSHARNRTITLPTRIASPGLISISRTSPLRLFSNPRMATRSFIGVAPSMPPSSSGISVATLNCLATAVAFSLASRLRVSSPLHPATTSENAMQSADVLAKCAPGITVSTPDNRPWPGRAAVAMPMTRRDYRPGQCP